MPRAAQQQEEPLYRRIQATMRGRIAGGHWTPDQSLPGREQLCEEFATTRVTLDKAIQGLIVEGLLRTTKRVGTFVVGPGAPPQASRRAAQTLRVGVVVERNSDPTPGEAVFHDNFYFGPLFQGVRDGISGKPVDAVFAHLHRSEYLHFSQESALDGMILITPTLKELPALRQLSAAGVSYVAVGISSNDPADAALPCVDTENQRGAKDAVSYLLSLGHRRVALINLATASANHHDRMEGYRQALAAAGLSVGAGDLVLLPEYQISRFECRVEEWLLEALEFDRLPTAVFACDYLMTLATLRVLRRHGLRVPEDISVVGFDDPLSAEHLTPPLTTVRQPVYRMGRRASERLLAELIAGTVSYGLEMLPTELVVRESACPPRATAIEKKEGLLR
jgi:DNA-binding LacI/PurR family transcriptional regulator